MASEAKTDAEGLMTESKELEAATAEAIAVELQTLFQRERGPRWRCTVAGVQRIKWYAPRIRHIRVDVRCAPS